jgi:hypothetical protein
MIFKQLTIIIGQKTEDIPDGIQVKEVPDVHPKLLLEWLENLCIDINANSEVRYAIFTYSPYIMAYLDCLVFSSEDPRMEEVAKHLQTKQFSAFINKDKVKVYDLESGKSDYEPGWGFPWESLSELSVSIQQTHFKILIGK